MEVVYVYNPHDDRFDNTSLLEKLGKPDFSDRLARGIIKNTYYDVPEKSLSEKDYEILENTLLNPVYVACATKDPATEDQVEASIESIKLMVSTVMGVDVTHVVFETYYVIEGFISKYIPMNDYGFVYPVSNEETWRLSKICNVGSSKPIISDSIFHHHALIESALSQLKYSDEENIFTKDEITYVVPAGSENEEKIRDVRMLTSSMVENGVVCLPRIPGDPRLSLFVEIAQQYGFKVHKSTFGGGKSVSIMNTDTEIPGHIWFEESAHRIRLGKIPLYQIVTSRIKSPKLLCQIWYIAILSYLRVCKHHPDLYRYINELQVEFNGTIVVPAATRKQVDLFKSTYFEYINTTVGFSMSVYSTIRDAFVARYYFGKLAHETLTFEIGSEFYVLGMFDMDFPVTSEMGTYYDELWEALGKPKDVVETLLKESTRDSLIGITALGPLKGMVTIPPRKTLYLTEGEVEIFPLEDSIPKYFSDLLKKKVGNLYSFSVIIGGETQKLFVVSDADDSLLQKSQMLWNNGIFLNDWARQFYRDTGNVSVDFLAFYNVLGSGISKKDSDNIKKFVSKIANSLEQ